MLDVLSNYALALGLTLTVEVPLFLVVCLKFCRLAIGHRNLVAAVIAVNLITHPTLHLLLWFKMFDSGFVTILFLESVIFFVEGMLLKYILKGKLTVWVVASFVANLASYLAGVVLLQ